MTRRRCYYCGRGRILRWEYWWSDYHELLVEICRRCAPVVRAVNEHGPGTDLEPPGGRA